MAALEPAWVVGLGGAGGVLVGVAFFLSGRRLVARVRQAGGGRREVVAGLAWRLGLVLLVAVAAAYFGGSAGILALLLGLALGRLVVRRSGAA